MIRICRFIGSLLLVLILPVWAYAACSGSSPNWTAADASQAEVKACYDGATAGDTINVPSGSATWTEKLTITKAITLIGSNTTLVRGTGIGNNAGIIEITLATDISVRVSGFTFDNTTTAESDKHGIKIKGKTDGSLVLTKIRIDHNVFNGGKRAISFLGAVYGLVDANSFSECDIAVCSLGDNSYAWTRFAGDTSAGTVNALFIENNTFASSSNTGEQIYHQEGGKTVTRFNNFIHTDEANNNYIFDSHGNWGRTNGLDYRGQPLIEVYNNKVSVHVASRIFYLRGGTALIYNNAVTSVHALDANALIHLTEEEGWTSGCPTFPGSACPWKTEYGTTLDPVTGSYFWNNTVTVSGSTTTATDVTLAKEEDATFIEKDRDYFISEKTGYAAYTCPHPLSGLSGICRPTISGTGGYNLTDAYVPWAAP